MSRSLLKFPRDISLPLFVYGALKPGMPAFERVRDFAINPPSRDKVEGELYVRDGLPLLFLNGHSFVEGFLLRWIPGCENEAYCAVREFEPRSQYSWAEVVLTSETKANVLVGKHQNKGNPQPLFSSRWRLTDDPAFGEGLSTVQQVASELRENQTWGEYGKFFRAQMAYLLLWSILERLSALCFGPNQDPFRRITQLGELPAMSELIATNVQRADRVADSRDPDSSYELNSSNPKQSFQYYYQVRCNLSHRGKSVRNEIGKVQNSLEELLLITQQYLKELQQTEAIA